MGDICLWNDATVISLLTSLTPKDVQQLEGAETRKIAEANVLVNDLPAAYSALKEAKINSKKERRVDIVLDNAGFELFVDLALAGGLLETGLAMQIVLHIKVMPWFVSTAMTAAFQTLLHVIAQPNGILPTDKGGTPPQPSIPSDEPENLMFLFTHWSHYHGEGQLILRPHLFWTCGHSYWDMPAKEPLLFKDLQESELVIFKGDLNYRKLTADVCSEIGFSLSMWVQG